jgi:hypothetical protein
MLKELIVNLPSTFRKIHFDFMNVDIAKTFYMYLSNKIEKVTFIDFDEFFEDVIDPDLYSRKEIFEFFHELMNMDLVKDFTQVESDPKFYN